MNVLVIDDHPLILHAMRSVVQQLAERVEVVTVTGPQGARDALATGTDFDLALLDIQLGHEDGFALLEELRAAHPALPIVVVAASDFRDDVMRAIDLGAMGFVPKRASNETLTEALHVVMSGGIYVPPMTTMAGIGDDSAAEAGAAARADTGMPQPQALAAFKLTPRQTDVLGLLLRGQSNKLIARELGVSVETVKDHVAAVLRALNVNSRTQAVLVVSRMGDARGLASWPQPQRP